MRISVVNYLKVRTLLFSSSVFIGDCIAVMPTTNIFAVQRQVSSYIGDEGDDLSGYTTYSQPLPEVPITENVEVNRRNENPIIQVGTIDIIGISTAAVVQIGSNRRIRSENRLHNTRQFVGRMPRD